MKVGTFPYELCPKVCKSKGGLKVHNARKHDESDNIADRTEDSRLFSYDLVINQLKVTAQKLSQEEKIFMGCCLKS